MEAIQDIEGGMMRIAISGGAGFLGSNIVEEAKNRGHEVIIIDNLSRPQIERNWWWIHKTYPEVNLFRFAIWNKWAIFNVCKMFKPDVIIHLAGQVGVTSSIRDPEYDFRTNALGTFTICEVARKLNCGIIYSSTNKVYGDGINDIPLNEEETRYDFKGEYYKKGIPESFSIGSLEHTPYGCSKLTGDLYVTDYGKVFKIPTVVNRMSTVYGKRQFGNVDQGWLSHFIWSKVNNRLVTVFGNGKQLRDMLYGSDCAKCYIDQAENLDEVKGNVFNLGGGWDNTLSLLEGLKMLKMDYSFGDWRPTDQKVYYSDISKLKKMIGWTPKVDIKRGLKLTEDWCYKNA